MRILAILLFAAIAAPALAAETPWQEVAPGVKLRLISGDVLMSDGTTLVGLEVDMPTSIKTYWRVPGETGVPTELDIGGSSGVKRHQIIWPYPRTETTGGYLDHVYRGPTVLPVELWLDGSKADLVASVMMGVCSEVCVPVTATFSLPLDFREPDRAQGLRIAQALALTPMTWDDPRDPIGAVNYDPAAGALAVRISNPQVDPLSVIADVADGRQLFGAPQKSPEADLVLLPLLGGGDQGDLDGKSVNLTFMTPMGPFEVPKRISPAGSTAAPE